MINDDIGTCLRLMSSLQLLALSWVESRILSPRFVSESQSSASCQHGKCIIFPFGSSPLINLKSQRGRRTRSSSFRLGNICKCVISFPPTWNHIKKTFLLIKMREDPYTRARQKQSGAVDESNPQGFGVLNGGRLLRNGIFGEDPHFEGSIRLYRQGHRDRPWFVTFRWVWKSYFYRDRTSTARQMRCLVSPMFSWW